MNKIKVKNIFYIKISSICVFLYGVCFSIRFLTNTSTNISGVIYFIGGIFAFAGAFFSRKSNKGLLLFILLIDCIAAINSVVNGNDTLFNVFYVFSAQAFGALLYNLRYSLKMIRFIYMLIYIYIVVKVIFFPSIDVYGGISISNLCGKNTISIVMMFSYAIDLIYRKNNNKKPSFILAFIGIIISLLTDSSGGILGFALIVIGLFICSNNYKLDWKKIIFGFVISILFLCLSGYYVYLFDFLSDDNSRFTIWYMYVSLAFANFKSFFLGANITNNSVLNHFFNIHNTILNWHCFMGFVPMILFVVILFYILANYIKARDWYMLVLFVSMFVRAMTDATDFCFMSMWIYMLLDVTNRKVKNEIQRK